MPSRKKAKGQARKAAKVKKEEELLAEKVKKDEEFVREFVRVQIQRLQVNNQRSVPTICMHGFDPFPNNHVCSKFIRAFSREYYKCLHNIYTDGLEDERVFIECLLKARESTQDEYSEVWNSADKIKQVISYFLYNGTMLILDGDDNYFDSAMFARFFEQWLKVKVQQSQACIDWPKVLECVIALCKRALLKYFWRRIRCSCLDEKYEEVKSIPKKGVCFNLYCRHPERVLDHIKLRCCSRCRSVTYCSRECQAEDWTLHKEFCDEVAAARAEFDANH